MIEARFSADGRMKQLEYAMRATERGGLVIGLEACDGGVIVASVPSEYTWSPTDDGEFKLASVAPNVLVATAGVAADARHAVGKCRVASVEHWLFYGERPSARVVARALAKHAATYSRSPLSEEEDDSDEYATVRPPGLACLVAGVDDQGQGALYSVNAAGLTTRFRAAAIGNGADRATSHLATLVQDYLPSKKFNHCWDLDKASAIDIALQVLERHIEDIEQLDSEDDSPTKDENSTPLRICIGLLGMPDSISSSLSITDKEKKFSSATFDDGWWSPNSPQASILSQTAVNNLLKDRKRRSIHADRKNINENRLVASAEGKAAGG